MILKEGKSNPIKIGCMIRILFVTVGLKNYVLPLTEVNLVVHLLIAFPFFLLFATMFSFIGVQLKNPQELIETRDWADKTSGEKINFVLTWFILALSIFIIIWVACITRSKLKSLEAQENREKAVLSKK